MSERERGVFGWLDDIRDKPEMYLASGSLKELESLIFGYYSGLRVHGIVEIVPNMNTHFLTWLHFRTKWSCCCGWAAAIDERYPEQENALAEFFKFVDEYRRLRPITLCTVRLAARHKPTGKRVCYGFEGRMEKPRQVDVVRYRPEPLHFLRFHYRDRVEDGWLLMTGTGEYATTVRYAKQWVHDELQVEFTMWEPVPRSSHAPRRTDRDGR